MSFSSGERPNGPAGLGRAVRVVPRRGRERRVQLIDLEAAPSGGTSEGETGEGETGEGETGEGETGEGETGEGRDRPGHHRGDQSRLDRRRRLSSVPDATSRAAMFDKWWSFGSTIIAPATLLSTLLFYFGYVSSRAQLAIRRVAETAQKHHQLLTYVAGRTPSWLGPTTFRIWAGFAMT